MRQSQLRLSGLVTCLPSSVLSPSVLEERTQLVAKVITIPASARGMNAEQQGMRTKPMLDRWSKTKVFHRVPVFTASRFLRCMWRRRTTTNHANTNAIPTKPTQRYNKTHSVQWAARSSTCAAKTKFIGTGHPGGQKRNRTAPSDDDTLLVRMRRWDKSTGAV